MSFEKTKLNKVGRHPERGRYDYKTVLEVCRAAPIFHVAFVDRDGLPQCVPMVGAVEETEDGEIFAYLHGHYASRFVRQNQDEVPMCITATLVDGIVFAASSFSHSAQYRSAVLHGTTFPFDESYDKDVEVAQNYALAKMTDGFTYDGRWADSRLPLLPEELKQTGVLRVRIESASAKASQPVAPTIDKEDDNDEVLSRVWTGIIPLRTTPLAPIPGPKNKVTKTPDAIANFSQYFEEKTYGAITK